MSALFYSYKWEIDSWNKRTTTFYIISYLGLTKTAYNN